MDNLFERIADEEKRIREEELLALREYEQGVRSEAPLMYTFNSGAVRAISGEGLLEFVASEESEDRYGDVISADGWSLDNFHDNPVFMLQHNYGTLPIGRIPRIGVEGKQLIASVTFDPDDELAQTVRGKYQRGYMNAVSVGFRPIKVDEKEKGYRFEEQELLELSAVSIPAHPRALQKALSGDLTRNFIMLVPGADAPAGEADEEKAGKVLSKANRSKLEDAVGLLKAVIESAEVEETEPEPEPIPVPEQESVSEPMPESNEDAHIDGLTAEANAEIMEALRASVTEGVTQ